MKKLALVFSLVFLAGCKGKAPVLSPIKDVGCVIEKAISGSIAAGVSGSLQCAHPDLVASDLQAAFGNANLCQAPVPAPAPAAPQLAGPKWGKISDVSQGDLDAAKGKHPLDAAKPSGVIGNIACPIAINSAVGFLSNSVPSAWGCSGPNASISGLVAILTQACEMAVPL